MGVTKPTETKPKKMVNRNVAVALGIICIVLVAGLAGTIIFLNGLNSSLSLSLNSQITTLQNQLSDFNDIVNLNKSYIIVRDENITHPSSTHFIGNNGNFRLAFQVLHSGYIRVDIQPYDPHLAVNVQWTYNNPSGGSIFSYNLESKYGDFGFNGTGYYPIVAHPVDYLNSLNGNIPTVVVVEVINNSTSPSISANVTITDYY